MRSARVAPDVITTAATPGTLFGCSLVPEVPAAGAASVEQLSGSSPWLLGKGWQLCRESPFPSGWKEAAARLCTGAAQVGAFVPHSPDSPWRVAGSGGREIINSWRG